MKRVLLAARGISLTYPGPVYALRDVSLTVARGDLTALLGPLGAGKSTLLRVLSFAEPPVEGDLLWEGRLIAPADAAELRGSAVAYADPVPTPLPALLLADDPTPALLAWLRERNEAGQSIILATEDPETAAWCSTIYRMQGGRLYRLH